MDETRWHQVGFIHPLPTVPQYTEGYRTARIAHRDAEFWGDVGKQIERSLEEA